MVEKWWLEPVVLELDGIGTYRVVRNTREAAQCLLEKWPVREGAAYQAAIRTCRGVLRGEQPMDYARQDFIAAAVEAFIHVQQGIHRERGIHVQQGGAQPGPVRPRA